MGHLQDVRHQRGGTLRRIRLVERNTENKKTLGKGAARRLIFITTACMRAARPPKQESTGLEITFRFTLQSRPRPCRCQRLHGQVHTCHGWQNGHVKALHQRLLYQQYAYTRNVTCQSPRAHFFQVPCEISLLHSHECDSCSRSYDENRPPCAGTVCNELPQAAVLRILGQIVHPHGGRYQGNVVDDRRNESYHCCDDLLTRDVLIQVNSKIL
mmetsp:Transcript_6394/g.39891  ORF Transcript_6394/g.39891 Transcript_6394/m.39891 type:complete len:213 (-) Transcript_6394:1229-1867(-)